MLNADQDRPASIKSVEVAPIVYEHIVWPYRLALPLMNAIAVYVLVKKFTLKAFGRKPRINFFLVDGSSISARQIKDNATSWRALDTIYNFKNGIGQTRCARALDRFWLRTRNAQAARNRLKMAKQALRQIMREIHKTAPRPGESIYILSLAAGSAQGVIEVIKEMRLEGITSKSILIDNDPHAIAHANALARKHGVDALVTTVLGDALHFDRFIGDTRPEIVEMMGLTDYLRSKLAVLLFKKIRKCLKDDGYFFTSNVHPNPEAFSLRIAMNCDMIYRSQAELSELLIEAGFQNPVIVKEPHGIQSFAYAQKQSDEKQNKQWLFDERVRLTRLPGVIPAMRRFSK